MQIFQGVHRGGSWGNYLYDIYPNFWEEDVHSFGIGGGERIPMMLLFTESWFRGKWMKMGVS